MKPSRAAQLLLALLAATTTTGWSQQGGGLAVHYTGALDFRGDTWSVRVHIASADSVSGTLDLPDLMMAWEPVPVTLHGDTLLIEIPFGLGEFSLTPGSHGALSGSRLIGGDTARLTLDLASPPPYDRETVSFRNGPATLVGDLVRPRTPGPHPAVALVHGSTAQGRGNWSYRSWADWFARRGFVVLFWDKRGVGESTGPWMTTSFADISDLAADVASAVRLLRADSTVDAGRIGLTGGSQAGWVSLLAARQVPVNFLILRSAPATTPEVQELVSMEYRMRAGDIPAPAIDSALQYARRYFGVVHSDTGWEALRHAARHADSTDWAKYVPRPHQLDDLYWWKQNAGVDPEPLLSELAVPVLFLYGAADNVVPPETHVPRLLTLTRGSPDVTVAVFPRADHGLEQPFGRDGSGRWRFPRKAPGALDALQSWLDRHGLLE